LTSALGWLTVEVRKQAQLHEQGDLPWR